jgi:hypothetical protein
MTTAPVEVKIRGSTEASFLKQSDRYRTIAALRKGTMTLPNHSHDLVLAIDQGGVYAADSSMESSPRGTSTEET